MSTGTPQSVPAGLSIAAVERETGLAKDTLRVWEKRYGYPQPLRDEAGNRLYPPDQVAQIKVIRRLLDAGLRPGKVVGLDRVKLEELVGEVAPQTDLSTTLLSNSGAITQDQTLQKLLALVGNHDLRALHHGLALAQARLGLTAFVIDVVAPLTIAVGQAWAQGRFEIYEEHLYTEAITGVLRHTIAILSSPPVLLGPTVLLTTVPQEAHGLGLLMVEALLTLEGCLCISLGTQTPLGDIAQAAQAHRADVIALSFTNVNPGNVVLSSLSDLRAQLPRSTQLWVGGACPVLYQKLLPGIAAVQHLSLLPAQVAQWRIENNVRLA